MARQKRSSPVISTARIRLAGLKAIKPKPNYGPGLTVEDYEKDILDFEALLSLYNQMNSQMDEMQNQLEAAERLTNDKNKRVLSATAAIYGEDSNEYEMVGGTRLSERKKRGRKKPGGRGSSTT